MSIAVILGLVLALLLHAGFLAFGGLLIPRAKPDQGTLQQVELLSEDLTEQPRDKEPEPEPAETKDQLEAETEEAPDADEIIRSLETAPANAAPALEAASLSAIADALAGSAGAGMGFGDAMSFSSGGVIGGTGKAGALGKTLEDAFNLAEIDQKPRAIFQVEPSFPAEMRGKKVEGTVTLIFVVDESGKVADARVEKSSHQAFERPALDALRKWRFEPGVKGGQRVACRMRIPIRFRPS